MREHKTELVSMRMTPAELEAVRAVANERSCSVGAVMRWAVKKAVIEDPPSSRMQKNGERASLVQSTGATPLVQS